MNRRRNVTIEDASPVIIYSPAGAWGEGTQNLDKYSGNSVRVTNVYNATASFQFNGTGVWVYGARRNSHGAYLASIDGKTTLSNAFINSTTPDLSIPLFGAPNLQPGIHTVSLKNVFTDPSEQWLNIDNIVVEMQLPDQSLTSVDDAESSILYTPKKEWARNQCAEIQDYSLSTCRITSSTLGTIQFAFQGDTIVVIGGVGSNHGSYNVLLDGAPQAQYNGKFPNHHSQQVLYITSGLGGGNHTLQIHNNPNSVGNFLDLDSIQVFGGNAAALPIPSQAADSGGGTSLAGPIAGAVVGAVALAAIVVAIVFYRRRRRHSVRPLDLVEDDSPAVTQMQDVLPHPYVPTSAAGGGAHSSYPPTNSQWGDYNSPSTTNLMASGIESDVSGQSGSQGFPVPLATAGSEKQKIYSREASGGVAPPPYEAGNSQT
ncbi:hypothetical protein FRB99_006624 [Tulasnella sp. 403]|nr:hypothetical protein FRB99_006624 [Tulasnella sp. 403]